MSENNDFLLYVISASSEIKWRQFVDVFGRIYQGIMSPSDDSGAMGYERQRTARILDALGHCDVNFDESGGKLYAAPPVLARLPFRGLPQAVLCGARGPDTISAIKRVRRILGNKFDLEVQSQSTRNSCIPQRIWIEAESLEILEQLARELQIHFAEVPISSGLVQLAAGVQEYLDSRSWSKGEEINWPRRDFEIDRLQFRAFYRSTANARLSKYDNPITSIPRTYLFRENARAQVDLDWGRYALLASQMSNILIYDSEQMLLAVPASTPLPKLFARASTLCSGYAPRFVEKRYIGVKSPETRGFDVFDSVPPDISEKVASKLGQVLIHEKLDVDLEEMG